MADFNWYLNKQGARGIRGEKGNQGYSPYITYGKNNINEFTLLVHNENETLETPNLKANLIDVETNPDGTYVRYNKATRQTYIDAADEATTLSRGEVILATVNDIVIEGEPDFGDDIITSSGNIGVANESKAVTPAALVDSLSKLIVTSDGNLSIRQNNENSLTEIKLADKVIHKNLFYNSADAYLIWSDFADDPLNPVEGRRTPTGRGTYGMVYRLHYDKNHFSVGSDRKLSISSSILNSINNAVLDINNIKSAINSLPNKYMTLDTIQLVEGGIKIFANDTLAVGYEDTYNTVARYFDARNMYVTYNYSRLYTDYMMIGTTDIRNIINKETYVSYYDYAFGKTIHGKILHQGNILAGDNVNVEVTSEGVKIHATGGGGSGANIDDTTPSLTKVFSSQHTSDLIGELGNDVVDIGSRLSTAEGKITVNETAISDLDESVDGLSQRVADIEGGSRVNAVIKGSPRILEGQVDGFTSNDYLQFPMIFEPKGRKWVAHMKFTTGDDVMTQQNLLDSSCSVAFAIRNREFVWALSSNGTSFNSGEGSTYNNVVKPNTTYWIEFSHEPYRGQGTALCSVFTSDPKWSYGSHFSGATLPDSIAPKTILIGGKDHPFKGSIDMRDWYLELMSDDGYQRMDTVWEGYAESSGKLDVDLNNINDLGRAVINDMIDVKINEALGAIGTALDDILYGDTN